MIKILEKQFHEEDVWMSSIQNDSQCHWLLGSKVTHEALECQYLNG